MRSTRDDPASRLPALVRPPAATPPAARRASTPAVAAVADPTAPPPHPPLARRGLLALALLTLALHVAVNVLTPYGFHRDELLYLAMGRHLRLWRMDFPPLIAIVAEAQRAFGDSLVVLRAAPALAAAALVVLAGLLAREFGGRRPAQLVAATAVATSPLFLRTGTLFQPVVLDQLWWTVALYALARIGRDASLARAPHRRLAGAPLDVLPHAPRRRPPALRRAWLAVRRTVATDDARHWLLLGIAGGLGLLTKFSIAFIALPMLAALALTPLRAAFRTRGPWLAAGLALLLGAPALVGQVALGWPVVGQMHDLRSSQLARIGAVEFLGGQLLLGPAALLAAVGLWFLLRHRTTRHARAVGIAIAGAFLLLLALQGKSYYVGPVYPALFAAGATALEVLATSRRGLRWALPATAAAVVAYGVATLPFGVPILPPPAMARYAALGPGSATTTNVGERLAIPQDYADMLGWPDIAAAAARAYHALPDSVRGSAAILAANYGEAGAVDLYGRWLNVPPVVSPAGSYWFFGPGERAGVPIVTVGVPEATLRPYCGAVRVVETVTHPQLAWVVPEERRVPIAVCEAPHRTLQELWPSLAGRN